MIGPVVRSGEIRNIRRGEYSDSNYVRDENSNASLGAYKWTGFFFGMGMAHQWPAVRSDGLSRGVYRRVGLEVKQGVAAKTQISVTTPSGNVTIFSCGSSSTCEVTVDDRQGGHWYCVQYLAADGKVVSQSDPALIDRRPGPPAGKALPDVANPCVLVCPARSQS